MIAVDVMDGIGVVRLAHGKVNALDLELCRTIEQTMRDLDDERGPVRAVVVTGAGRVFSAGVDLKRVVDGGAAYVAEFLPALSGAFRSVFDLGKPVVAAVNGHAIAGGCVLAAACDCVTEPATVELWTTAATDGRTDRGRAHRLSVDHRDDPGGQHRSRHWTKLGEIAGLLRGADLADRLGVVTRHPSRRDRCDVDVHVAFSVPESC
ncbi:enoyl-CoA hydratase/isomerase family protein [Nonomuraea sp. H19]|uniref:enoyl-CoA hydratase/isomerase family protein n=1 Tax=Nonomuraea sp. H19 TaxID=3452206 RepID=UPI003F8B2DBA